MSPSRDKTPIFQLTRHVSCVVIANKHNAKTRETETEQTMAARRLPPPADPINANYQPVGIQRRRSNGNDRIADDGDASAATAANGNSNYNPADAGIQQKFAVPEFELYRRRRRCSGDSR